MNRGTCTYLDELDFLTPAKHINDDQWASELRELVFKLKADDAACEQIRGRETHQQCHPSKPLLDMLSDICNVTHM